MNLFTGEKQFLKDKFLLRKNYESSPNLLTSKYSLQYIHDDFVVAYIFSDRENLIKNNFLFLKTQTIDKNLRM